MNDYAAEWALNRLKARLADAEARLARIRLAWAALGYTGENDGTTGLIEHSWGGACPDMDTGGASRQDGCPACEELMVIDAALREVER